MIRPDPGAGKGSIEIVGRLDPDAPEQIEQPGDALGCCWAELFVGSS